MTSKNIERGSQRGLTTVGWNNYQGKAYWKVTDERFYPQKRLEIHPFFDLKPMIDYGDKTLYFFVVNPIGNTVVKDLDLVSGKFHKLHNLCEMEDAWSSQMSAANGDEDEVLLDNLDEDTYFSASVPESFPYTEGRVPRILDQQGYPLKIIVFGRKDYFSLYGEETAHKVRVVGGVLEQFCDVPPCRAGYGWESHYVLVGVDVEDETLTGVKTMAQLKKVVNWREILAFMRTAYGVSATIGKTYPAYRVIKQFSADNILKFSTPMENTYKGKDLLKIRGQCFKLYDLLWKVFSPKKVKVSKTSNDQKDQGKDQEKDLEKDQKKNQEEEVQLKFKDFHAKFGLPLISCSRFISPSNIHLSSLRHWTFSYLLGLYRLNSLGHYFRCDSGSWNELSYSIRSKDQIIQPLDNCTPKKLDKMMRSIPAYLERLRIQGRRHLRYLEFDNSYSGTHREIYSWTETNGKFPACLDNPSLLIRNEDAVFPKDIKWKRVFESVETPSL